MLIPDKNPRVIISDVDETLTERTTWYVLTEALGGSSREHARLFTSYLEDHISFKQLKQGLFALWRTNGPVHKDQLVDILKSVPLRGEAYSFFKDVQKRGYQVCLISGSISLFVELVAQQLGITDYYGNSEFIFDDEGYWIDLDYTRNEAILKKEQLMEFLKKNQLEPKDCIALGDGSNDVEIFSTVPGIAVNPSSRHLRELAWKEVKYLPRVLQLLQTLE